MATSLHRATVFTLYQLSIIFGIAFLPVALAANQIGVSLPVDKLLTRLKTAYEQTVDQ